MQHRQGAPFLHVSQSALRVVLLFGSDSISEDHFVLFLEDSGTKEAKPLLLAADDV